MTTERGPNRMTIFIPTPLRTYAEGKDAIEISAGTIADALEALTGTYPELRKHLLRARASCGLL